VDLATAAVIVLTALYFGVRWWRRRGGGSEPATDAAG
jgi:hypothetical protein